MNRYRLRVTTLTGEHVDSKSDEISPETLEELLTALKDKLGGDPANGGYMEMDTGEGQIVFPLDKIISVQVVPVA